MTGTSRGQTTAAPRDRAEDPLERALSLAWVHLDRRERTVAEVSRHLQGKGVDPAVAEQAVAAIAAQGYLDDRRFARLFASDKRRLEHWGTERIRSTLRARGVDPELVDQVLGEEDEEPDCDPDAGETRSPELRRALALLARRYPGRLGDDRERNRALGLLLRRGYDSDLAYDALRVHRSRS